MQLIALLILLYLSSFCFSKEYKAVDDLNLPNYMGKWYQVYKDKFDNVFQKEWNMLYSRIYIR